MHKTLLIAAFAAFAFAVAGFMQTQNAPAEDLSPPIDVMELMLRATDLPLQQIEDPI